MPVLHVDITGDCTGLTDALSTATSGLNRFGGTTATAGVQISGVASAMSGLNRLSSARDSAGGMVNLGVDTSGINAGRSALGGLRSDVRDAGRDFDAVSGSRAFGLTDDGSVRQVTADVRGLGAGVGATEGAFGRFGSTVGQSLGRADAGVAQAGMSMQGLETRALGASAGLGSFSGASAEVGRSGSLIADSGAQVEASLSRVQTLARDSAPAMRAMASAMSGSGGGSLSSAAQSMTGSLDQASAAARRVAFGGGPPFDRGPGGGGGGGGDGVGGGRGGGAGPDRGGLGGLKELGGPAMIGVMGGAVDEMIGAGAGVLAVGESMKAVPGLAHAGTQAMQEFTLGVRSTASAALGEGVPALAALGAALRPLGAEVGTIGAQQMGAVLGGATQLAGSATSALHNLEPAIGPAISGAVNLGNALIQGVGSSQVVSAVKSVGASLQGANVASGISDLTTGVLAAGGVITQVAADAVGGLGGVLNALGGPSAQQQASPALTGGVAGAMALRKTLGGGLGGGLAGGLLGAMATGVGGLEQQQGMSATPGVVDEAIGATLGGVLGSRFGPAGRAAGAFAGGALGQGLGYAEQKMGPAGNILNDTLAGAGTGALAASVIPGLGTVAGAIGGGAAGLGVGIYQAMHDQGGGGGGLAATYDAQGRSAQAPHGWDMGKDGSLTPSAGPGGGGGRLSTLPGWTQPHNAISPGSSSSATGSWSQDSQGRIGASDTAPAAPRAPGREAGLSQMQQSTVGLSSSVSQLGQQATTAAQPLQQVTQHATTAASSVSQLGANSVAAMAPLRQVAPTASAGLSSASSAIQASSRSLGQSVPAAMASGVSANTGQACDAANQMGKSAVNCAKDAVKSASPSREFMAIGESTGQGFAIGVQSTAGLASGAVSTAMTGALGAGASALGTASPSKAFAQLGQSYGRQAAQGVAQGATQGANGFASANPPPGSGGAGNPPTSGYGSAGGFGDARYPQMGAANAQRRAEQQAQAQQSPWAQQGGSAFDQSVAALGYSPSTMARLEANQAAHNDRAAKLAEGRDALHLHAQALAGGTFRTPQETKDAAGERHQDALGRLFGAQPAAQADRDAQNRSLGWPTGAPAPGKVNPLPPQGTLQAQAAQAGNQVGQNLTQGLQQGVNQGAPAASAAAGNMTNNVINQVKKKAGTNSPSTITTQVGLDVTAGLTGGLTSGITAASAAISPIANNSGLMVGYVYGQSMVSGVLSVIKSADFATAAVTGIGSQLAQTALGQLNMLGPAGSGGEISKVQSVTVGDCDPHRQCNSQRRCRRSRSDAGDRPRRHRGVDVWPDDRDRDAVVHDMCG